jgi:hypothetical protein
LKPVLDSRFQILDSRFQILDSRFQILDSRFDFPMNLPVISLLALGVAVTLSCTTKINVGLLW